MDSELSSLTSLLERFDRDLFAKRTDDGVLRVYHRKGESHYHVFSLTDTWGYDGASVKWGYMPLYQKLQAVTDIDRSFKEVAESEALFKAKEDRNLKNITEEMAHEMRDAVKKDMSNVLTHSMDRKKDKRRLYEKRSL